MDSFFKQAEKKNVIWKEMISNYKRHYIWGEEVPSYKESINQDKPSIMFFKAKNTSKKTGCVLIIPGGCYLYESTNEAVNVANKITENGINAAILNYRLFPYTRDVIMSDAIRAIKYLNYYADYFDIVKEKTAVVGFSAGGNLATITALNQEKENKSKVDEIDAQSSKVDALGLCYGAVYQNDEYMTFDDEHAKKYFTVKIEERPDDFPPTFIWHSFQDSLVDPRVSLSLAQRLNSFDIPVELHMFPYGMHGQGLADTTKGEINEGDNELTSCWSDLFIRWLKFYGF